MHLERKPESKLPGPAAKLKQFIEQRPLAQEGVRDVLKLIKACSTEDLVELGLHPPPLPVLGPILSSQQALPARLHSVQVHRGSNSFCCGLSNVQGRGQFVQ